jgi:cation/acetate symporter
MAAAFLGIWVFSLLDHSRTAKLEEDAFEAQYVRSQTGLGAAAAAAH